jgi:hypothetical protein
LLTRRLPQVVGTVVNTMAEMSALVQECTALIAARGAAPTPPPPPPEPEPEPEPVAAPSGALETVAESEPEPEQPAVYEPSIRRSERVEQPALSKKKAVRHRGRRDRKTTESAEPEGSGFSDRAKDAMMRSPLPHMTTPTSALRIVDETVAQSPLLKR